MRVRSGRVRCVAAWERDCNRGKWRGGKIAGHFFGLVLLLDEPIIISSETGHSNAT